jgi:zinc transport system substrate-binding protein
MKVAILITLMIFIGILFFSLFDRWDREEFRKIESPPLAATIFPLYDMVRQVVGEEKFSPSGGSVHIILPKGASPHTFEPTPKNIAELTNTKIIFAIGYGIDDWVLKIAETGLKKRICRVDTGIELLKSEDDESGVNPHYWLSITNAMLIVENIEKCIIEEYPSHETGVRENVDSYKKELKEAQEMIRQNLSGITQHRIITFHDAFPYFAAEFGLNIITSLEPFPGKAPTPKELISLQNLIINNKIDVIFTEPQLSPDVVLPIAEDLGLQIYRLDPEGSMNSDSYIDLMLENSIVLKTALE